MSACYDPKDVHVRAYKRTRFGNEEDVCEHWRKRPYQYKLF